MNLGSHSIVQPLKANSVATGTSEQFSDILDCGDADEVLIITKLGTAAADNIVRIQQNTANSASGMADLEGSAIVSGTSTTIVHNIVRPRERYLRVGIARGTTTVIESVIAVKSQTRKQPTTQPTGVLLEVHPSPAEGTA